MTIRKRRGAPWYAPATRRLSLVRVGLPTLVACLIAMGPGAAAQAQSVPPKAAALVARATTLASQAIDPPPGGHGPHRGSDHVGDER
jgi:hypothetical protein